MRWGCMLTFSNNPTLLLVTAIRCSSAVVVLAALYSPYHDRCPGGASMHSLRRGPFCNFKQDLIPPSLCVQARSFCEEGGYRGGR